MLVSGLFVIASVIGAATSRSEESCQDLNGRAVAYARSGAVAEAEELLSRLVAGATSQLPETCLGSLLSNLAAVMQMSGRLADGERLAERSIVILQGSLPPNDPALLRPLGILTASRLELGKLAAAREAFQRMQAIPIRDAADRALICGLAGALLKAEGKLPEAEAEYRNGLQAYHQSGRADSADAASVLNSLGELYQREKRFDEAIQALDRCLSILTVAPDALPMDRIKALNDRAVVHVAQGHWDQAARDLSRAVSLLDDYVRCYNPAAVAELFYNYAAVLRKTRHSREAREFAAQSAALHAQLPSVEVVDVSELLQHSDGKN